MKILVACEESQAVCKAFRELGHEAYSCDTEPCSGGHPEWHIQDDVLNHLAGWDMIIAFPPCTYLANVSAPHYNVKKWGQKAIDRMGKRLLAVEFFLKIKNAPCDRIVIENPNPSKFLTARVGKYTQYVHPYYFGEPFSKKTCLWIKGLPPLSHHPKNYVEKGKFSKCNNGGTNADWYFRIKSDKNRAKNRSKTFPGIANAMAAQWGNDTLYANLYFNNQIQLFA